MNRRTLLVRPLMNRADAGKQQLMHKVCVTTEDSVQALDGSIVEQPPQPCEDTS